MQRLDPERCVGVAGPESDRRVLVRESLNEWVRSKSSQVFLPPPWGFDPNQGAVAWPEGLPRAAVLRLRLCQLAVNLFSVLVTID